MQTTILGSLASLTPFSTPSKLPVIAFGKVERTIRTVCTLPNSKGMILVECLPDMADKGIARQFLIRKSTVVLRMREVKV